MSQELVSFTLCICLNLFPSTQWATSTDKWLLKQTLYRFSVFFSTVYSVCAPGFTSTCLSICVFSPFSCFPPLYSPSSTLSFCLPISYQQQTRRNWRTFHVWHPSLSRRYQSPWRDSEEVVVEIEGVWRERGRNYRMRKERQRMSRW